MFLGKGRSVVRPHPKVRQVSVFTAQGVGKNHAGSRPVNVLGFTIIASMLDGIGRNRDRPQLTRVDLRESSRRLSPASPIKFCIVEEVFKEKDKQIIREVTFSSTNGPSLGNQFVGGIKK